MRLNAAPPEDGRHAPGRIHPVGGTGSALTVLTMDIVTLIGAVATLLTAARVVPQLLKLRGTSTAHGVPVNALTFGTAAQALWTAYGISARVWPMVAATAVGTLVHAAAVTVTARRQQRFGDVARAAVLSATAAAVALAAGGWVGLSLALLAVPLVSGVALVRDVLSAGRVTDLSFGMLAVTSIEAVVWIVYLGAVHEYVLVVNSGLYIAGSAVAWAAASRTRARNARRAPDRAAAAPVEVELQPAV